MTSRVVANLSWKVILNYGLLRRGSTNPVLSSTISISTISSPRTVLGRYAHHHLSDGETSQGCEECYPQQYAFEQQTVGQRAASHDKVYVRRRPACHFRGRMMSIVRYSKNSLQRKIDNVVYLAGWLFQYLVVWLIGTVFQTALLYLFFPPRLRPGLLSLRSVLAFSQIYQQRTIQQD